MFLWNVFFFRFDDSCECGMATLVVLNALPLFFVVFFLRASKNASLTTELKREGRARAGGVVFTFSPSLVVVSTDSDFSRSAASIEL